MVDRKHPRRCRISSPTSSAFLSSILPTPVNVAICKTLFSALRGESRDEWGWNLALELSLLELCSRIPDSQSFLCSLLSSSCSCNPYYTGPWQAHLSLTGSRLTGHRYLNHSLVGSSEVSSSCRNWMIQNLLAGVMMFEWDWLLNIWTDNRKHGSLGTTD